MPLNIDWQQILLHLLNFAILCGGLYLLLYKPVKDFMARRLIQYETREAETRQREADADAMREKYQSMLRQAEQEILARREKVGEELEEEKRQQLAEARAEARKILSTAAKTAELRTKKALEDSHEEIRALAIGMVERMVVENSGDALDQFLNEAEGGVKPQKDERADAAKADAAKTRKADSADAAKADAVKTRKDDSADAVKKTDAAKTRKDDSADAAKTDAVKTRKSDSADAVKKTDGAKTDAVKTEPAAPARKPAAKSRERGTRRG